MYVDEVNEIVRLNEDSDEGDTPMAGEAYSSQVDVKRRDVCRETLNYLDKSHHRQLRVYKTVRYVVSVHIFQIIDMAPADDSSG